MSKTAQRKRQFYREGQEDYRKYGQSYPFYYPSIYRKDYLAGYNDAKKNDQELMRCSEKRTFWQWVKYLFWG